jgi:asparagine synthetase B (glutamine-hydrolysing)
MSAVSSQPATPVSSSVEIEGSPTIEGRLVQAKDLPAVNPSESTKWIAFARRIRGQFSIIAKSADTSIAVTDLSGCYPVFLDTRGTKPVFGGTLESVTKGSHCSTNPEFVARFTAFGTVGAACSPVKGIRTIPGSSVSICDGATTVTTPWADWSQATQRSNATALELEEEFRAIMTSWGRIYLPPEGRVGVLLSGGTDSALLAALMKPLLGDRLVSITQDFFLERYSERAAAIETAERIGIPIVTAKIGRADYFRAFRELNSASQNSVVHYTEAHNLYCLTDFAKQQGINTLITGYNADYLFLGLGHFFAGFPPGQEEYQQAISRLSLEEKLERVIGKPPQLSRLSLELLDALRVSPSDYNRFVDEEMAGRRQLLEPFARVVDLPTLQQLRGQINGGLEWQDEQGCLAVMRALPGCNLLCPFYDPEIIRFALRLPRNLIFNEGQTKYLLRRVLKAATGLERPKRPASMSPMRFWRLLPNLREYSSVGRCLQKLYFGLLVDNIRERGTLSRELTKIGALGVWLRSHQLGEC